MDHQKLIKQIDRFKIGTPAVHHFISNGEEREESGEIVMNSEPFRNPSGVYSKPGTIKGILLYPNENYSGPNKIFVKPNWFNVEKFAEEEHRQIKGKKFVIKDQDGKPLKKALKAKKEKVAKPDSSKVKEYHKTHRSQKAVDAHVAKIKSRGGHYSVSKFSIKYSFPK
jgi:hypothetical protein